MRVSVLMPVHDAERFVREAVDSLLTQTFEDFELIVVDDGSTDSTPEILRGYDDDRLIVVRHLENRGYVHALNTGLERAQGELIARQDADDISYPSRLAIQVAFLDAHPDVVLVGSAYEVIDEQGKRVRVDAQPVSDTAIRFRALFHNPFAHSTVTMRAAALRVGGLRYDTELEPSEDYALWSALLETGRGGNLERPLVRYRVHGGQVSTGRGARQEAIADEIAQANLRTLGIEVPPGDIRPLRRLAQSIPDRLAGADLRRSGLLLEAAGTLARRPGIDRRELAAIRRSLARRIAAAAPGVRELSGAGLVGALLRAAAAR